LICEWLPCNAFESINLGAFAKLFGGGDRSKRSMRRRFHSRLLSLRSVQFFRVATTGRTDCRNFAGYRGVA
jgi:hypothetical protein